MTTLPWIVMALGGCETVVRFPPDQWGFEFDSASDTGPFGTQFTETETETDAPPPPLVIERTQWGCDNTDSLLEVSMQSNVRSSYAEVTLFAEFDLGPWSEIHPMSVDFDQPKLNTRRAGPLQHDAGQFGWIPEVATALNCTTDVPQVSFAIRAWDLEGVLADCVLWNPTDAVWADLLDDPAVVALGGCTVLLPESL